MAMEYVVEYDVKYMGERLKRELAKNRRDYFMSWFTLALCIMVWLREDWMPYYEQAAFVLMGIFSFGSIIWHGRIGTFEMLAIAESMPVTPAKDCLPLLLKLLPFALPRRAVWRKIDIMLQQLDQ